jgi:glycosyltransferase involved in cell wall biosynthesis
MATATGPTPPTDATSSTPVEESGSPSDSKSAGEPLELSVVMPCLNEERTVVVCVEKAIRTMRDLGVAGEVVIVDNGSTDRSVELAEAAGARVVRESLRGYGNALRRGFEEARGRYIIMADCDDSYDLTDLERFLVRLRAGAELVMGNRLKGEIKPGAMPWHHRWFGNPVLSTFLNLLFHTEAGDCHCGMRGFTKDAFRRMCLRMPGMELASEMVIKSASAGLRIEEIPIVLYPDGRDRPPHLRSFRDGWRHLRFILMCSPVFLFVLPGLLLTLLGLAAIPAAVLLGYGVFTGPFGPNFMFTAAMLSVVGWNVMIFGFLAKLYTHQVDSVFQDPRVNRVLSAFSVERGLIVGVCTLLVAVLLGGPVLIHWILTFAFPTPSPARWILACTLATLGVEMIFASFLVGILDLPRESSRKG